MKTVVKNVVLKEETVTCLADVKTKKLRNEDKPDHGPRIPHGQCKQLRLLTWI